MSGIKDMIIKSVQKDKYEKYIELIPELKSEKNEKMVMIILTIIAIILLGLLAVKPTLSTIVALQKQLDDSRFFESKLQEKINNLASLDQQYHDLQSNLPIIYSAVPKTSEAATLSAIMQTIVSSASNVKLTNLQMLNAPISKNADTDKTYSTYNFSISAEGNYQDLLGLVDKLINFQRIITIKGINIVKSITLTESVLTITVTGDAYFKK